MLNSPMCEIMYDVCLAMGKGTIKNYIIVENNIIPSSRNQS